MVGVAAVALDNASPTNNMKENVSVEVTDSQRRHRGQHGNGVQFDIQAGYHATERRDEIRRSDVQISHRAEQHTNSERQNTRYATQEQNGSRQQGRGYNMVHGNALPNTESANASIVPRQGRGEKQQDSTARVSHNHGHRSDHEIEHISPEVVRRSETYVEEYSESDKEVGFFQSFFSPSSKRRKTLRIANDANSSTSYDRGTHDDRRSVSYTHLTLPTKRIV